LYLANRALERRAAPFLAAGVLREADVALVDAVAPRWGEEDPEVLLALALAVRAPRAGHVGVDLRTVRARTAAEAMGRRGAAGDEDDTASVLENLPWPTQPERWEECVRASRLVGPHEVTPAHATPFVFQRVDEERALIMTRRMSEEQHRVAAALRALSATPPALSFPEERVEREVRRLFAGGRESGQAAQAVRTVCRRRLTLVTGGPGTGKTYSIARTLAALLTLHAEALGAQQAHGADGGASEGVELRPLRVALAAPTGKAAVRMKEAIVENMRDLAGTQALPQGPGIAEALEGMTSKTLHSLLGVRQDGGLWRDARNPLEADVVIVDEASMIDLVLMRMLLEAVPPGARLVLLGDPDQLASVEAGTVLADLLEGARGVPGGREGVLVGTNVPFTENHRFKDAPKVGAVAGLIRLAARAGEERAREARDLGRELIDAATELLLGEEARLSPDLLHGPVVPSLLEGARDDGVQRIRAVRLDATSGAADGTATNRGLWRWLDGDADGWPGALPGCPRARGPRGGAPRERDVLAARTAEDVRRAVAQGEVVDRLRRALDGGRPLPWERVVDAIAAPYLGERGYVQALLAALVERRQRGEAPLGAWSAAEVRPLLDAVEDYRVLAVHRQGARGVAGLNRLLRERVRGTVTSLAVALARLGARDLQHGDHWLGEIVLVTRNAYDVDLRNGDVGLVLPSSGRQRALTAWFPKGSRGAHELPLARLPPHELGLAMTVHKSQGSQFRRVALVLAARASALQSRELVYTALTRAQACIDWYGEPDILRRALASPIARASGLGALLRG